MLVFPDCRRHDDPDGDWELIDTKTDELWESRHEIRTFQMSPVANLYPACDEISIVVTDLRDAQYQGGAGVGLDGTITTDLQQQTFTPKMQLAEVSLFNDASVLNPDFVTEVTTVEEGVPIFTFILVVAVLGVFACVLLHLFQREKVKSDLAVALISDLGFDVESMTREDVEDLKQRGIRETFMEAFHKHDVDASGGIDKTELEQLLTAHGFQLESAYVDSLWSKFDTDNSGSLEKEEFGALMHKLSDRADEIDAARVKPTVDADPDTLEEEKSKLYVTVVSASGLPKKDLLGENDPFVVVSVNGVTSRTSAAYAAGADPSWGRGGQGERLSFLCKDIPSCVSITVLDDDFNLADLKFENKTLTQIKDKLHSSIGSVENHIGSADVDLAGWDGKRRDETVGIVSGENAGDEHIEAGSVLVRFTWEPVDFKKPPPLPRKSMNPLVDLGPQSDVELAPPVKLRPPPDLELAMPPRPAPERSGTPPRGGGRPLPTLPPRDAAGP